MAQKKVEKHWVRLKNFAFYLTHTVEVEEYLHFYPVLLYKITLSLTDDAASNVNTNIKINYLIFSNMSSINTDKEKFHQVTSEPAAITAF